MYQKSKPSLQHQRQLLLHNSVIHSFILQMPWHTLNPHLLFTIVCSSLFSFSNFLKLTFCCPFLVHFWICHTSQKSNLANFLVTIDILFWLSGFPMTWQVRKKESIINTYLHNFERNLGFQNLQSMAMVLKNSQVYISRRCGHAKKTVLESFKRGPLLSLYSSASSTS